MYEESRGRGWGRETINTYSVIMRIEEILMKVLSLFDGMSCGMLAMKSAGIDMTSKESRYVAYEIDKNAIEVSRHNFPMIEHKGDVFKADFTEYKGFDFVIGGSPCTFWSIAQQPGKRETEAHGMGWDLFQQYVRAIKEAEPKYFIYENNKSMSNAIRESISGAFGFEPICIDSALVSAQSRQRLYWVGIRNEDGTYRKANIEQPTDRGILLKDVVDGMTDREKDHAVIGSAGRTTREYFMKNQGNVVLERADPKAFSMTGDFGNRRASVNDKAYCLAANPSSDMSARVIEPIPLNITKDGKSQYIRATCYKDGIRNMVGNDVDKKTCVAEPVAVASRTRDNDDGTRTKRFEARGNKANCLTATRTDSMVAEPIAGRMVGRRINEDGHRDDYNKDVECVQRFEVNKNPDKTNCLTTVQKDSMVAEPIRVGALPTKGETIYEVKDGKITIKGRQYPIKLADGFYIIRKLTVTECKRLQTVPDDYDMSVISNTQAYRCLGNGWTVEVIAHLIKGALKD